MNVRDEVYHRLDEWNIPYRKIAHAPAATLEECAQISRALGAMVCKNYFLTTRSRKHYCLCIVRPQARLRTADISRQAGTPRLSFADEKELMALLHTRPGSVSPMGLLFTDQVRLLVDRALQEEPELAFHPCENTETLVMQTADFFHIFLPKTGVAAEFVDIHDFMFSM